jgi:cysteinyl-tRNA synthetase
MQSTTIESKRLAPDWKPIVGDEPTSKLRLYNSFTKRKEIFVPKDGNRVIII